MNFCNISVLNLLLFGITITILIFVGEVAVYMPIATMLFVKFCQVTVKKGTQIEDRRLFPKIIFFLIVAFIERVMIINEMTILSYYTSFMLICAASYLVLNIDNILINKVSDETIISIIISYLYLLLLYFYPQNISSFSVVIWLAIVVSFYFLLTNQLLNYCKLTSSQVMIIEQSQWLLFIYSAFRLISNIFAVKLHFSLIFYICALVLFLMGGFSIIKEYKKLNRSLIITNISTCLLVVTLGVECCYFTVQN